MAIKTARIIDDLGVPIPDVNVVNTTTNQGTFSNFDGWIKIEAADSDKIKISHVGQSGKQLKGIELQGDIVLLPSDEFLDEVVISSNKKKGFLALGIIALIAGGIYMANREYVEQVTL
ncbi:hypothetical protein ACOSP6_11010 [Tenacibaculum sp. MEBiC06402]|uniref:hypothetical protein n=1 Tax=unclassified Tenacibaculum TaxID=2635139 RepID=UPI003B9D1808